MKMLRFECRIQLRFVYSVVYSPKKDRTILVRAVGKGVCGGEGGKGESLSTLAIIELLCLKNADAQISMFFTSTMAIEKIKILGAILELPAKQQCQSSPFTSKKGQMG